MSTSTHHVYFPVEELSKVEPPLVVRNVKTIGFVRDDFIHEMIVNAEGKVTIGERKIKANMDYVNSKTLLRYSPYMIFAVMDWVDSEPLLTPKYLSEVTTDPWKHHLTCLEISKLFPVETMTTDKN